MSYLSDVADAVRGYLLLFPAQLHTLLIAPVDAPLWYLAIIGYLSVGCGLVYLALRRSTHWVYVAAFVAFWFMPGLYAMGSYFSLPVAPALVLAVISLPDTYNLVANGTLFAVHLVALLLAAKIWRLTTRWSGP